MLLILIFVLLILVSYSIYSQRRFGEALKENTKLHKQLNKMLDPDKLGVALFPAPKAESVSKLLITIAECEEQLGGMRVLLIKFITILLRDMHTEASLSGHYNYAKLDDIVSTLLVLENRKDILSNPAVLQKIHKDVRNVFEKLDKEEHAFEMNMAADMAVKIKVFLAEVDRDYDVEFLL